MNYVKDLDEVHHPEDIEEDFDYLQHILHNSTDLKVCAKYFLNQVLSIVSDINTNKTMQQIINGRTCTGLRISNKFR